jgi:outer membrane receptor for ferrienterochelin and colicins
MKGILVTLFCLAWFPLAAQNHIRILVKDSVTGEKISGAIVRLKNTTSGASTDENGIAEIRDLAEGLQYFDISFLGYTEKEVSYLLPLKDPTSAVTVFLSPAQNDLEEVIVSTTRTNSRIDDLPTKIEVLAQEEMDEESTLVPGSVTSILGDLSIITVQHTSQVNGNEAIRMQGIDSRYTQIMRDGFPLYGGFSGSLGVLSIPPLDLKQVEIIKGSASTLYGGGAIGGLINFISKAPADSNYTTVTLNATTLKEGDFNLFSSVKGKKTGFTVFGGANTRQAVDINGDDFTEVPSDFNFTLHPRLFFNLSPKTSLVIGLFYNLDNRSGGDIDAVKSGRDSIHPFLETEKTFRNTGDLTLTSTHQKTGTITFKTAGSSFQRDLNSNGFVFNGIQYSFYNELNDVVSFKKHTLVAGLNYTAETFLITKSDALFFHNYSYSTAGCFVQDDWQVLKKVSLQAGLRYDHHNTFGDFFLPRISIFYKPTQKLSIRFASGTGYKTPNLFDLTDPQINMLPVSAETSPERSIGINADISYHRLFWNKLNFIIDQAFYYTNIKNPLMITVDTNNYLKAITGTFEVNSYGTDTYIRFRYEEIELYVGYNHTESLRQYDTIRYNMPFNPKDKFSMTLAYEIESEWRFGLEAAYSGNQYVTDNIKVHDIWFMAAMLERKFKRASIVINCENLLDQRQSKYESLVRGTRQTPIFKPVWGNLEGRVVNLSFKINL